MSDATIVVPTHDHAAYLPVALRSALAQRGAGVDIVVIGDGVGDDTRAALAPFLADPRVRFLDLPKGERHGERHRHPVLLELETPAVVYLSDDDLLAADHVALMLELLEGVDFAHAPRAELLPPDELVCWPMDLARPTYRRYHSLGVWNAIGLTGVAHTLDAYRRLPHGWRTTPAGTHTDYHMWRQFIDQPWFRGRSGETLSMLSLPQIHWGRRPEAERLERLSHYQRLLSGDIGAWRDTHAADLWRRTATARQEAWIEQRLLVRAITGTRTWRAREAALRLLPLSRLLARRRGAP